MNNTEQIIYNLTHDSMVALIQKRIDRRVNRYTNNGTCLKASAGVELGDIRGHINNYLRNETSKK